MDVIMYNEETMGKLKEAIVGDEFDDDLQNEQIWSGFEGRNILEEFFERNYRADKVLDLGCGSGASFHNLPIDSGLEPHPVRFKRLKDKVSQDDTVTVKQGWAENIPWEDSTFDTVMSWGTMMFVRSMMEALAEVNRVLKPGGVFIFDVVSYTTMPIAQTINPECFPKYVELFGFRNIELREFGEPHYQRLAVATMKVSPFNPRSLMLPQCRGDIRNFLETRDWFLR